jgi:hypothetical protein
MDGRGAGDMVRWMRTWLVLLLLCASGAASAQSTGDVPVTAKIVLQAMPEGGIEAAAWTPDGRYLITAVANSRAILIWDIKNGLILDRLTMPPDALDARATMRALTGISMTPDGSAALIDGVAWTIEQLTAPTPAAFRFRLDLKARTVTPDTPPPTDLSGLDDMQAYTVRDALTTFYFAEEAAERAEAEKLLLPLPRSPDGEIALYRTKDGLKLVHGKPRPVASEDGGAVSMVGPSLSRIAAPMVSTTGVALLAPDGRRMVAPVPDTFERKTSFFTLANIAQFEPLAPIEVEGYYDTAAWLLPDLLMLSRSASGTSIAASGDAGAAAGIEVEAAAIKPAPIKIVDLFGIELATLPARCHIASNSFAQIIGAGPADCTVGTGPESRLQRVNLETEAWEPWGPETFTSGFRVLGLSFSPSGLTLGVALGNDQGVALAIALDAESGMELGAIWFDDVRPDRTVTMVSEDQAAVVDLESAVLYSLYDGRRVLLDDKPIQTMVLTGDGFSIAVGDAAGNSIKLFDAASGSTITTLAFSGPLAGGFLPDNGIFWAVSSSEGLRFWNARDWSVVATTMFPRADVHVTVTPEGRYDTNTEADAAPFRWLVSDAPEQSLGPQTFMRDYYQPGLIDKLLDCSAHNDCAVRLSPLRPIAGLNRVLPEVTITGVTPGDSPEIATVSLRIREGQDPAARNGKTRSGIYNVQLFRDYQFDSFVPTRAFESESSVLDDDMDVWRVLNKLDDTIDSDPNDGVVEATMSVLLPTRAGSEKQMFTAYAFNSDRVKSETASYEYVRDAVVPRTPRAFIISIGIDAYDVTSLKLDYAAKDAVLMGYQLGRLEGYDVRQLVVAGARPGRNDKKPPPRVTGAVIRNLLAILAGDSGKEVRDTLSAAGIDASMLEMALPDDLVIISFSGHGWADKDGDFYLVPADGAIPPADAEVPDTASLVASWELTGWLRYISAGQIALILDTCHSGASFRADRFRPGPMGDAGLGQLAYDKGIRILAATQAGDVAYEDKRLKHGVLTYALAGPGEALSREGSKRADSDGNGKLDIDEWLNYAVMRLPELNESRNITGTSDADDLTARAFLFPNRKPEPEKRIQQPTLFNYAMQDPAVIRSLADAAPAPTATP